MPAGRVDLNSMRDRGDTHDTRTGERSLDRIVSAPARPCATRGGIVACDRGADMIGERSIGGWANTERAEADELLCSGDRLKRPAT